jgi:hypothetical protein
MLCKTNPNSKEVKTGWFDLIQKKNLESSNKIYGSESAILMIMAIFGESRRISRI